MDALKVQLNTKYGIKDLGPMKRYLSYQVSRNRRGKTLVLHQHDYIKEVLDMVNMGCCAPSTSKGDIIKAGFTQADLEEKDELELIPYRRLTGALQQLATHSRPDISYEVATLSKFNKNCGKKHFAALKQLLKYLKGTSTLGLTFDGTKEISLEGYADSSFAVCPDTCRAVGGCCFTMNGTALLWKCWCFKKVYPSSTESDIAAIFDSVSRAIWLKRALISVGFKLDQPIVIHEDKQNAINYLLSKDCAGRMKHIDSRFFWIREMLRDKQIVLKYVPSADNVADIFTKSLRGSVATTSDKCM